MEVGRFAPSITGRAHPGTLLSALLCWLDARSRGGRAELRLEDLDRERLVSGGRRAMHEDLDWFGLDWDDVVRQSDRAEAHEAALDRLAAMGLLYPCACSRKQLRARAERGPDGGWRYPGTCRGRRPPAQGGWRACREPLRLRLPEGAVALRDEGGADLSADPFSLQGDPVVRRRDGAVSYQLASIVDDRASGVTRVVRGRDLASSTALQVRLQRLLGYSTPSYRHHMMLLEERGGKLAKLHGSVAIAELRAHYRPDELCGLLAHAAGLLTETHPVRPAELLARFDWSRVRRRDRVLRWSGGCLEFVPNERADSRTS